MHMPLYTTLKCSGDCDDGGVIILINICHKLAQNAIHSHLHHSLSHEHLIALHASLMPVKMFEHSPLTTDLPCITTFWNVYVICQRKLHTCQMM